MDIIGHQKIVSRLEESVSRGVSNHAYLFSGPEHVGKFTAAKYFAEKIVGKTKSEVNPDIVILAPETDEDKGVVKKKDIKVEAMRDFLHRLGLSAQGKKKVAIVDDAERMTVQSQNALLKTLEEAASDSVIILVAHDEKKLLPTILSRCQKVRFGLVSNDEMRAIPALSGSAQKDEIVFWSFGRPGVAFQMLNDAGELDFFHKVENDLRGLFAADAAEKMKLAEDMSKNTEEAKRELELWVAVLRESIIGQKDVLRARKGRHDLLKLLEGTEKTLALMRGTNANARLLLENIFLEF